MEEATTGGFIKGLKERGRKAQGISHICGFQEELKETSHQRSSDKFHLWGAY